MYIEELVRFGLGEKEAKVYLALLELEIGTANEIAKAAEVNRSSTYVVLDSLQKRGLVSVSGGKSITKYVVAPPDRLVRIAEQIAKKQVDVKDEINMILPDLRSLYKGAKQKPRIQIFEGKENIITHLEETLLMREKVMRVYSSGNDMHAFLREYMSQYMEKRARAQIRMYGIHPDGPGIEQLMKHQPKTDKSVIVPPHKYKFTADFAVYDDTVGYVSHKDEFAITIESKEIAEAMKSAFDLAFEGASLLSVKKAERVARR